MKTPMKFAVLAGGIAAVCGTLAAAAARSANSGAPSGAIAVVVSTGTYPSVVPSTSTLGPMPGSPSAPGSKNPSNPNPSSPAPGGTDGPPSHP